MSRATSELLETISELEQQLVIHSRQLADRDLQIKDLLRNLSVCKYNGIYKGKRAYQWHDEYTRTLRLWHEEVDALKRELVAHVRKP